MKPLCKIGILTPKAHQFDGYDFESESRQSLRDSLLNIFSHLEENHRLQILFNFNNGGGIEVAKIVRDYNLPAVSYVPYNNPSDYWSYFKEEYAEISKMIQIKQTSLGKYSPKKYIENEKEIVQDSDCVIFMFNKIKGTSEALRLALDLKRPIFLLPA